MLEPSIKNNLPRTSYGFYGIPVSSWCNTTNAPPKVLTILKLMQFINKDYTNESKSHMFGRL